jgi:integrase
MTEDTAADDDLPEIVPPPPLPAHLQDLTDRARGYVEAASSTNTRRAYAADWKHFSAWCRRSNLSPLPPDPQVVGLYITACASGSAVGTPTRGMKANSVSTIERRLSALSWNYAQRSGQKLDRKDRAIATVMAGIRNTHAAPSRQKEAILPDDLIAMLQTLDRGTLRGLRDRAMLLIGFAGALRRSEITGLDLGRDQTEDSSGWIEILDKGLLLTLRGKTGWREVEVGRGSSDATCPVVAVETWITFARLAKGPLFRRVTGKGKDVGPDRLQDRQVARLVKSAALAAGVRGDLSEGERASKFSGHSLRAGLASSAEVDERYIQKQLGHASAEMTRRYQRRRDRFRVNLTKASGL